MDGGMSIWDVKVRPDLHPCLPPGPQGGAPTPTFSLAATLDTPALHPCRRAAQWSEDPLGTLCSTFLQGQDSNPGHLTPKARFCVRRQIPAGGGGMSAGQLRTSLSVLLVSSQSLESALKDLKIM